MLKVFPEELGDQEKGGAKYARQHPNRETVFLTGPLIVPIITLIAVIGPTFLITCGCDKSCWCGRPKKGRLNVEGGKKTKGGLNNSKGSIGETPKQQGRIGQTVFGDEYD
ncbi:unnamed protein product [Hymenolepis diminuta]|uniref:Uncharacterized protein n=1 Tax=Hymenolepis diminuta TaxID=6216 RepID=A0A0R3SMY2_HYMDI|nr:unnamed protein product [Hymenolepis diminuta]